jgi:hypothetical protein
LLGDCDSQPNPNRAGTPFPVFSSIERDEAMGRPRPIAEERKRADGPAIRPLPSTARNELVATFH